MARHHHVDVVCDDELWRTFKARCLIDGVELRVRLGELLAAHMGVNPPAHREPIPGQQELEQPPARSRPRRSPASPPKRPSGTRKASKGKGRPAK